MVTMREMIQVLHKNGKPTDLKWFIQYMGYQGSIDVEDIKEDLRNGFSAFSDFLDRTVEENGIMPPMDGCYYALVAAQGEFRLIVNTDSEFDLHRHVREIDGRIILPSELPSLSKKKMVITWPK